MFPANLALRVLVAVALVLTARLPAAHGQDAQQKFYQAYYAETATGDAAAAAKLYQEVLAAPNIAADLKAQATARLAVCKEDVASADLTRLMPPNPLGYFELARPGERVRGLVRAMGLLGENGKLPPGSENRLAISPALLDALFGMRGAAVAITGFDPVKQSPAGVAVFHPGDMEVVRGLIETALPAAAKAVEPVRGYPTYDIEGKALVTMTARLVIVSGQRAEIEAVIDRLKSPDEESLASSPLLKELQQDRGDALAFFFINPKPLMPLINGLMTAAASQSHELAVARALFDIQSLRSLSGSVDVGEQGLRLELTLRLDKGHRNLVYNLLRRPGIDPATLRCIPSDAAAFVAIGFNPTPASYPSAPAAATDEPPVVTLLDVGREVFANVNGLAVLALPPADGEAAHHGVPDVGAVFTVNDPAQSQALWNEILGVASLATGAVSIEGETREIDGQTVRCYRFGDKATAHVLTVDHRLLIGTSPTVMTRMLQTLRGGKSIMDEGPFARRTGQLTPDTTLALMVHPARCMQIARSQHATGNDFDHIQPLIDRMTDTIGSLVVVHSDQMLRLSAAVTGVPDVGDLVAKLLTEHRHELAARRELDRLGDAGDWAGVVKATDELLAQAPHNADLLREKFNALARLGDVEAALAVGEKLAERFHDDAMALNNFAWELLTEDYYGKRFGELALRLARQANELTHQRDWTLLDTLALAEFEAGHAQTAVELEQKALTLCQRAAPDRAGEVEQALRRFQAGSAE